MAKATVNPQVLVKPSGYSHAVKVSGGTTVFLAGQTGMDVSGKIVAPGDLVAQFTQALSNLRVVVEEVGWMMTDVVKLTIFVTDRAVYRANLIPLGATYRSFFGRYFPAMTLVEVKSLFDDEALVEIDGVAVIA